MASTEYLQSFVKKPFRDVYGGELERKEPEKSQFAKDAEKEEA